MQQRSIWLTATNQSKTGTLVIIKDDHAPSLQWYLGRICHLYTGADKFARVTDIQTANDVIKRSLTKLCPLPFSPSENA